MNLENDKGKILVERTLFWILVQVALLLVIVARLYYLQVSQADKFHTLAEENRISTRLLIPQRGVILDRNQKVVAGNRQNFQVMIVAEQAADVKKTLEAFKKILPLSDAEEERVLKDIKRYRRFVPIKIKDGLSWDDVTRISLASPELPGIIIDDGLSRYYPFGSYTAHILGYVSSVYEKDMKQDADPLLSIPGFKIGKEGIEKSFEKRLRGEGGNLKLEVNAVGRVMKEIERVEGVPGEKIVLTIDTRLQKKAYELYGQESGAAVLLDVRTGEILAFVSTPAYDSNDFARGVSYEQYAEFLENERSPLLNKAVNGLYSPGSTFKMMVALAALEAGVITKDTKIYCSGKLAFGNHLFHCWKHSGHGHLNVAEALQHSCDVFFYEVANKLGIDKIAAMSRRFGLGAKTGIDLPSESKGLIPDKKWKIERYGKSWQGGETLIAGIGQGYIQTTPLQLAVMTARIANGGLAVKPSFTPVSDAELKKLPKIKINKAYLDVVREGMCSVVNKSGGTALGSQFEYKGQRMCGKTGTTQVRRISLKERQSGIIKDEDLPWKYRNHALFVGYAPQDNPKYAVAVLVEHGRSGSGVAAPIASKLLLEALKLDEEGKH